MTRWREACSRAAAQQKSGSVSEALMAVMVGLSFAASLIQKIRAKEWYSKFHKFLSFSFIYIFTVM
jgi:hypothetical protein